MMSKWEMVRLGDVITVTSGGTPSRTNDDNWARNTDGNLYPWVKTGDLKSMYLTEVEEYITACGLENSSAKLLPSNTVLLAMYGATIGACSILKIDATTNQACAALLPSEKYMAQFLYYYFASIKPKLVSLGVGGAQPNISGTIIKSLQIPMPPIAIQHKITSVLDHASALIEKRKVQIAKLDLLVKSQFIDMFGDPVANPMGWEIKTVGDVCHFQGGYAFKSADYVDKGVSLVKITNVNKDSLDWHEISYLPFEYLSKYSNYSLRNEDVVMAMTRPLIKSLSAVKMATVTKDDLPCLLNQRVGRFVFKENISSTFFVELCKFTFFKNVVDAYSNNSLQPNISSEQVESIQIPLPPISIQHRFATIVKTVNKSKSEMRQGLGKLELLYKSLMQKCFNGELVTNG